MLFPTHECDLFAARAVLVMYAAGSVVYTGIELLFRGYTHFSMVILGGLCGVALYGIDCRFERASLWQRALLGAAAITALELISGVTVNLWLGLGVWDYRDQPFHFLGQICPRFSFGWFLLCFPALALIRLLKTHVLPCLHGSFAFRTSKT